MRRILLSVGLLFAITLPCSAQGDKAKPNTLTPKEIADGWILLFDGETTFGWTALGVQGDQKQTLAVQGEALVLRGRHSFTTFATTFDHLKLDAEYISEGDAKERLAYLHIGGSGSSMRASLNQKYANGWGRVQTNAFFSSKIKFQTADVDDSKLLLRNIKLRPLDTTPLFNGKDLTGWKTFPGAKYKSKFAVIDNAINVKDGPGDLQTLGKYKDFILQLECKSNGKHLNSGIFFRCRDNEYQNGYEAQIRNQFTKEPTQKYLIEDYDPKTHKLLGKKEIKSTAVDFGTGAIYRRVPARKEMSKDGEWFSMTIAAQGNHFATWVNGVQVTDWTDNRPLSDNARTGCRLEAGHISIQGHDPTTDLSFRNIRIAEIK